MVYRRLNMIRWLLLQCVEGNLLIKMPEAEKSHSTSIQVSIPPDKGIGYLPSTGASPPGRTLLS